MKPYVVSADLSLLWKRAAGIDLPKYSLQRFRSQGSKMLESIFGACDWIQEDELVDSLQCLLDSNDLPVVSLDRVYAPSDREMSITRLVDENGSDAGYGSRDGSALDLSQTVRGIAERLPAKEVVLVDDVLFSGSMCAHIIGLFREHGVRVPRVYAGVAIQEGVWRMQSVGCEVYAVRTYEEVIDEVCERDFMPGAPLSGRTVKGFVNTGAPYLQPFGNPVAWASIPKEYARSFSSNFLHLSADIYREMQTRCSELPRGVFGLTEDTDALVSDALEKVAVDL